MLKIIHKRKVYYGISLVLLVAAVVFLAIWGFKTGIDFTGGSLLEISFGEMERPANQEILEALSDLELGEITIQPSGEKGVILRFQEIDEKRHQAVLNKLENQFLISGLPAPAGEENLDVEQKENFQVEVVEGAGEVSLGDIKIETSGGPKIQEERFDSIGPSIGRELKTKSFYAIIIVIAAIIAYIAWAFRKVGRPVASWKYGVIAVIALIHDVIITCGIFAVLGHYFNIEINTPFVAAVLTILGYSVNNTIVVFDRVRENLHRYQGDFEETINMSINETLARSINTSLTTLLILLAVFFFGGETVKYFVLALVVGIMAGTYSSVFLSSPLLVTWQNLSRRFGK